MLKIFGCCAGLALVAGCGLSEVFPSPTGGGSGIGVAGGSSGGSITGRTIGGNTGNIGGSTGNINGTTTNGRPGSSSGGIGSSTGRVNGIGATNAGPGGATGTGTGGRTNGGATSTGGSTTGCASEFSACDPSVGCPCTNLSCVFEPLKGGFACEHACKTTADCPTEETVCDGTACTIDLCGEGVGGPPNGSFDGPCNSEGTNDGTCVPIGDGGEIGVCFQGGSSDGGCVAGAPRGSPSSALCVPGDYCQLDFATGVGDICYTLCVPGDDTKCLDDGFIFCFKLTDQAGVCQ